MLTPSAREVSIPTRAIPGLRDGSAFARSSAINGAADIGTTLSSVQR